MATLTWVSLFSNNTLKRSEFITNFRTRINEDTEDLLTDIQIKANVPDALREINKKTGLLPEFLEVALDGSEYYVIPSGTTNVKQVCYIDAAGNQNPIPKAMAQGTTGQYRLGNRLYIKGTYTGTLRVYAARIPTYPTEDAHYIDLPDEFLDLLYLYFELLYWKRTRMDAEIQNAFNLYNIAIIEAEAKVVKDYGLGSQMYGKTTR